MINPVRQLRGSPERIGPYLYRTAHRPHASEEPRERLRAELLSNASRRATLGMGAGRNQLPHVIQIPWVQATSWASQVSWKLWSRPSSTRAARWLNVTISTDVRSRSTSWSEIR